MDNSYRIMIRNGDRKIELESNDKVWIEKKQQELSKSLGLFAGVTTARAKPQREASPLEITKPAGKLSINEFYRKYCSGKMSQADRAVFFIYYIGWVENKKQVSTNDVKDMFVKAGIPKANTLNYSDILARAKKRALLNYIDNAWSLTITGEDFVLNKIQDADKT